MSIQRRLLLEGEEGRLGQFSLSYKLIILIFITGADFGGGWVQRGAQPPVKFSSTPQEEFENGVPTVC